MSLLNGMNQMFENKEALEMAEREILIEDEFAMESGEAIDCLVDGVPDDYPEYYDDDDYDEALEAAALTGKDFLNSLNLSQGDPIESARRMSGSLGSSSAAANFPENFHDDFPNNNDPSVAYPGSVTTPDAAANFPENFHEEYEDDDDPLKPKDGSLGYDDATPRDPALEGTMALGFLTDDTYDNFDQFIAEEGLRSWAKDRKLKKRDMDSQLIGVSSMNMDNLDQLCKDGMWSKAEANVNSMIKEVEARRKALAYGDKDSKKKDAAARRLLKSYNALQVHIAMGKCQAELIKQGYDSKSAKAAAKKKAKELKLSLKKANRLDAATEAAIDLALNVETEIDLALEASIGQPDAAANFGGNYSDGKDDPSATYGAVSPGESASASFEKNYTDGFLNSADPIIAGDASVGYDDATPRDPATESYQDILDELDNLDL